MQRETQKIFNLQGVKNLHLLKKCKQVEKHRSMYI